MFIMDNTHSKLNFTLSAVEDCIAVGCCLKKKSFFSKAIKGNCQLSPSKQNIPETTLLEKTQTTAYCILERYIRGNSFVFALKFVFSD